VLLLLLAFPLVLELLDEFTELSEDAEDSPALVVVIITDWWWLSSAEFIDDDEGGGGDSGLLFHSRPEVGNSHLTILSVFLESP